MVDILNYRKEKNKSNVKNLKHYFYRGLNVMTLHLNESYEDFDDHYPDKKRKMIHCPTTNHYSEYIFSKCWTQPSESIIKIPDKMLRHLERIIKIYFSGIQPGILHLIVFRKDLGKNVNYFVRFTLNEDYIKEIGNMIETNESKDIFEMIFNNKNNKNKKWEIFG